jgi:hypothetical protein
VLHRFQSAIKSRIPSSCHCATSLFPSACVPCPASDGLQLPFPGDLLPHDNEQGVDAAAIRFDPRGELVAQRNLHAHAANRDIAHPVLAAVGACRKSVKKLDAFGCGGIRTSLSQFIFRNNISSMRVGMQLAASNAYSLLRERSSSPATRLPRITEPIQVCKS